MPSGTRLEEGPIGTFTTKYQLSRLKSGVRITPPKAGGTGLNLTAAQYVFILEPRWNPVVEAQAVGRTHRMGQENPATVYRLVGEDTIEERLLALSIRLASRQLKVSVRLR